MDDAYLPSADTVTAPPDTAPCWAGEWSRVDVKTQVWGQAAVLRTVGALPKTHPWRLGGTSGSLRQVQWTGRPATVPEGVLCVLSVTAADPGLQAGSFGDSGGLAGAGDLFASGAGLAGTGLADVVQRLSLGREQRWAGALVRMPGSWLPASALLPRGIPGVPAPRTDWATESVEFDDRFVVHGEDERHTADLLSPSVMSVLLDTVPRGSAVSMCGDALQVWWPYDDATQADLGRVQRAALAAMLLVRTFPRFVLNDYPDRSAEVERSLARKAEEAHAYREQRTFGHTPDPVLQRIYDEARSRV